MSLNVLQKHSLKTRVTLYTLATFVIGIWSLAFYASRMLRDDMERVLGEAQLSTVSYIATAIDADLVARLGALKKVAEEISPAMMGNPGALQALLESHRIFQGLFNGGNFVTPMDGIVTASLPLPSRRIGVNLSDREYIVGPLRDGKAAIGVPVIGRALRLPSFAMTVPVRDAAGKVIGALGGVIDLSKPNFLDTFTGSHYGKTGDYLLIAPQQRLIVTATDKARIMTTFAAPGQAVKGSSSRFMRGYEGYDVIVNQLGVEVLASAKSIPIAGWRIVAMLPTAEAFSPIRDMQRRILLAAALLTLLVGLLTWHFLNGQFASMRMAAKMLARMSDPGQSLIPIPILHEDEVGQLIGGFNRVLETLRLRDAALQASDEKFRSAIANAAIGVVMSNPGGMFLDANAAYSRITGYSVDQLRRMTFSQLIHPDDFADNLHLIEAMLAGDIRDFVLENRFCRSDGDVVWVRESVSLLRGTGGVPPMIIALVEDITDRKRAEDVMRAAMAHAERANNAKSRFLAAASHDLRQPLSALSLYMTVLKGKSTAANQPLLANMKECISSLSSLLTDLLDLSKLEAGVVKPKVGDFSVAEALASLDSIHRPEAQFKGLRLRCVPTRLVAHSDAILFKRLLGNLIDNAIRYTESGGVLVACRRRQGKTWVEVWDTGVGIAADMTDEVFEEFRQLGDDSRSRGSGLGLAIVARTAALLELEILVRSRPGRGSLFAVELPLGQQKARPALVASARVHRPLRIALIDDNTMVRQALACALRGAGHRVFVQATGAALLAELGGVAPDIVVSDYRLGGGETGFDVITLLRARIGWELPAILITGDTDPYLLRSMTDRGIPVLHKPLDLDILQTYLEGLTSHAA